MLSPERHPWRWRGLRLMHFDAEAYKDLLVLGLDIWQYAEMLNYL